MIKKIISLAVGVILSFSTLFSLSGCHFHNDPPKSITINGEKYLTGFYDEDYFYTEKAKREDTCLFTKDDYSWWKIVNGEYELYGCILTDAIGVSWFPQLYCKESEFDKVKAYYDDCNNYTYSFQYSPKDWVDLPDDIDKEKMIVALETSSTVGKRDPLKGKGYPTFSAAWTELDLLVGVYIKRMSKDKILETGLFRECYNYINGNLCVRYSNPSQKKELPEDFYILNDETHTYILELFETYALDLILQQPYSYIYPSEDIKARYK